MNFFPFFKLSVEFIDLEKYPLILEFLFEEGRINIEKMTFILNNQKKFLYGKLI